MICDELPDEEDLFAADVPAPIAMCSHLIRSVPESVSERKLKVISSLCATPAPHRCPGCLPPAAPALDARAVPVPVPRLLLSSGATSGNVPWTGAWSPARI